MKLILEGQHNNARELSSRLHKLNIEDPAVQSEIVTPENDLVIHRIVAENLVITTLFSFTFFFQNSFLSQRYIN